MRVVWTAPDGQSRLVIADAPDFWGDAYTNHITLDMETWHEQHQEWFVSDGDSVHVPRAALPALIQALQAQQ
jgi:hypothetical protein